MNQAGVFGLDCFEPWVMAITSPMVRGRSQFKLRAVPFIFSAHIIQVLINGTYRPDVSITFVLHDPVDLRYCSSHCRTKSGSRWLASSRSPSSHHIGVAGFGPAQVAGRSQLLHLRHLVNFHICQWGTCPAVCVVCPGTRWAPAHAGSNHN